LRQAVLVSDVGGYGVKYEREVGLFEWLIHCLSSAFEVSARAAYIASGMHWDMWYYCC